MKGHKWQPEQIAWLKANRYELNNVEIVARFNQTFGLNLITHQITNACKSRGFKHKNTGFAQGNKPWNTGLKGVNGKSSTTFKKGNYPFNTRPVGSERITKDGYLEVKVAEPRKWEAKHRLVWQSVNGTIAKGDLVIFIGDNKLDCSIENLQMVTRGELAVLNRHEKYSKQSPEIRMALINLVRLEQAANLKIGDKGINRSIYSMRHTSLLFAAKRNTSISRDALASNARTSTLMLEKHYLSTLENEDLANALHARDSRIPKKWA